MIQPAKGTIVLGREEWEEKYLPVMDKNNFREMHFHWGEEDKREFKKRLAEIEPDEAKRHFHTWTLMTDDDGDMVICNGIRFVNRLEYIITTKPWEEGEYIVVDYEKEGE